MYCCLKNFVQNCYTALPSPAPVVRPSPVQSTTPSKPTRIWRNFFFQIFNSWYDCGLPIFFFIWMSFGISWRIVIRRLRPNSSETGGNEFKQTFTHSIKHDAIVLFLLCFFFSSERLLEGGGPIRFLRRELGVFGKPNYILGLVCTKLKEAFNCIFDLFVHKLMAFLWYSFSLNQCFIIESRYSQPSTLNLTCPCLQFLNRTVPTRLFSIDWSRSSNRNTMGMNTSP